MALAADVRVLWDERYERSSVYCAVLLCTALCLCYAYYWHSIVCKHAMRRQVLTSRTIISLRAYYAMSGTDLAD
eukprot:503014-Rhodomonas_salina.1